MTLLKEEAIRYIETQVGRDITYASISPSIFRYLEIRDLRVVGDNAEELLGINRVRVYYNILGLLSDDPAKAFFRFSIENSEFRIDTKTDSDIIILLRDLMIGRGILENPFAKDLEIAGKNLSFILSDERGSLSIDRLFFNIKALESAFDVQLRGRLRFDASENELGLVAIKSSMRLQGVLNDDFLEGDFQVNFREVDSNLLSLNDLTLQVAYEEQQVLVRKMQDDVPIDVTIQLGTDAEKVKIAARAQDFKPDEFVSLGDGLRQFQPWMSTIITGTGDLSYSLPDSTMSYSSAFSLKADNRELPFPVEVTADLNGDSERIVVTAMHVDTEIGNLTYSGLIDLRELLPVGTVTFSDVKYRDFSLDGEIEVMEKDGNGLIPVSGNSITINGIPIHDIQAEIELAGDTMDFEVSLMFPEGVEGNRLQAEGIADFTETGLSQVTVHADKVPLDPVWDALDVQIPASIPDTGYFLSGELSASSDFEKFSFASRELTIQSSNNPLHSASFAVIGNNSAVSLQRLDFRWDDYRISGDAMASMDRNNLYEFRFDLSVQDLPFQGSGYFIPGEGLSVVGNYDLNLTLLRVGHSVYRFSGSFSEFPLPISDKTAYLSLDMQGLFNSFTNWNISIQDAAVIGLPAADTQMDLRISGSFDQSGGTIRQISFSDSVSELQGSAVISDLDITLPSVRGWLRLGNDSQSEWYECTFDYLKENIKGTLLFEGASLGRIPDTPITGRIDGNMEFSGSLDDPTVSVGFSTTDARLNYDPISAAGQVGFSNGRVSVDDLRIEYITNSLENGKGYIDTRNGTVDFAAAFRGTFLEDPVTASVSISARSALASGMATFQDIVKSDASGSIAVSRIFVGEQEYPAWDAFIDRHDRVVRFEGGPQHAISGELEEGTGRFSVSVRDPIPVRFTGQGVIEEGMIDAKIDNVHFDFDFLASYTQIPYFHPLEGEAGGSLSIQGQISDPDYYGLISTSGVRATVDVVPEPLGPFDADIVFSGKTFQIIDVRHDNGQNVARVDAFFTIEHWIPVDFEIRIETMEKEGVHIVYSIAGIDIDGFALGSFTVSGDQYQTTLSGDLTVQSCLITLSEPPPPPEPEPVETIVDLRITTGRTVEFLWPNRTVPIVKTTAETGGTIDIQYRSGNESLKILGEVDVKSGTIYYFQRSFFIREGKLVLNENENEFDPVISARAELREVNNEGESVRIYLILDQKPFSQFSPRFESDPPMNNVEIASLLGQRVFTQVGNDRIDLGSALLLTSDILSQFSVVRSFEDRIKEILHLDLFSFRTQILQNVIINRLLYPDSNPEGGIGQYLDNTTLFLGKYFGNDIFLEAMISLRADTLSAENFGMAGNLYVESELSFEWKTPLFLLDFSLMPDLTDIFSSGTNASLGLSWGFSF